MRVLVDRDRCEGNAVCVRIAPEGSSQPTVNQHTVRAERTGQLATRGLNRDTATG
jgi:ferredoxin